MMVEKRIPPKIAFCGEVSSGKSTVLQSIMRKAFLPDFFGIQTRPTIRVVLGADTDSSSYLTVDGVSHQIDSPEAIEASEDITEIVITFESTFGLQQPCELIEFPPLRDGHVDETLVQAIADCDGMVWTTIGSQAWRLSEKTILDEFADHLPAKKVLVATRADKFRNSDDRAKLLTRLETETANYTQSLHLLGVSPKMFEKPKAAAIWRDSGAGDFVKSLNALLRGVPPRTTTVEAAPESAAIDTPEEEVADLLETQPTQSVTEDVTAEITTETETDAAESSDQSELSDAPVAEQLDTSDKDQPDAVVADAPEETADQEPVELVAEEPDAPSADELAEENVETASDPLADIVSTMKGIVAIGTCDILTGAVQTHIYGDEDDVILFGQFCIAAVSAAEGLSECSPATESLTDMQIVTDQHNLFLSRADTRIAFIAGQSSNVSVGTTRNILTRVIAAGLTTHPDISEAA